MNRKLLLISNSTNAGESYLEWTRQIIPEFLARHQVKKVLFIPFAGLMGYDVYEDKVRKVFCDFNVELTSIHHSKNPIRSVMNAECIAVGGGNTFHLVHELHRLGLMQAVGERVFDGMPYMGWSAGANVAGPTLKTTNDMPIIDPLGFDCMNLVPFQINPHYTDFFDPKHGGETRDDRLIEFLKVNKNVWVAGIREATALSLENGNLKLIGRPNKMKVFRADTETKEYDLQDDINFLMK